MTRNKEDSGNKRLPMTPFSPFHLEIDRVRGGISVLLGGIIGINDFSEERVELSSHGGRIVIRGKKLGASVYEQGNCEVRGRVEGVDFVYGKN